MDGRWYKTTEFDWCGINTFRVNSERLKCSFIEPANNFFIKLGDAHIDLNSNPTDYIFCEGTIIGKPAYYYTNKNQAIQKLLGEKWDCVEAKDSYKILYNDSTNNRYIGGDKLSIINTTNNVSTFELVG